jgi:hypothetical protein
MKSGSRVGGSHMAENENTLQDYELDEEEHRVEDV